METVDNGDSIFNITLSRNDEDYKCKWKINVLKTNGADNEYVLWDSCWTLGVSSSCKSYPSCNKLVLSELPENYHSVKFKVAIIGFEEEKYFPFAGSECLG